MSKEVAEKAVSEAAEKAAKNEVLSITVTRIKNAIREAVFAEANLSKTGRSGGAIGAQLDKKVGARLVQEGNKTGISRELSEALKKEGARAVNKGGGGVHK